MSGKSQTIRDFTVSRPSQILRSNGDDDGSDNGKKLRNRLRLAKQQLVTWITLFWHSLPSLHDYDVKMWRTWTQHNNFLFLSRNFDTVCQNSTPEKNCQHLTNLTRWNKCDKVWSSATSLFKWRFRSRRRRRRCCLSSLFNTNQLPPSERNLSFFFFAGRFHTLVYTTWRNSGLLRSQGKMYWNDLRERTFVAHAQNFI